MINPLYLEDEVQRRIKEAYTNNIPKSVMLQEFLDVQAYAELMMTLGKSKLEQAVVADRHSRSEAKLPLGVAKMIHSASFRSFIKRVTGKDPGTNAHLEIYAHRDYTLRQDDAKPPGVLLYLDLTGEWEECWGGETIVSDAEEELVRVKPRGNTLVMIDCRKAWPFVRYVNHYAEGRFVARIVWRMK